ncbi:hypothetical protein AB9T88_03735, partial [Flavobacterium sp. LBUM151]
DLENITVTDPLPGIAIFGSPIDLAIGQMDNSSIRGTYTLTQADLNAGTISNQAIASGVSKSGIIVTDKSDFSDLNGERPTVLELGDCLIKIFNAVSSNFSVIFLRNRLFCLLLIFCSMILFLLFLF